MSDVDLSRLNLDVYATREGQWNPEHGELEIPEDWDFLAGGCVFDPNGDGGWYLLGGVAASRPQSAASTATPAVGTKGAVGLRRPVACCQRD